MKQQEPNDKRRAIEGLWRETLQTYREEGLEERLTDEWPDDGNVNDRIAYGYPPTFQPGHVGPRYFAVERRIVLVGQNPGEGSDPVSKRMNLEYQFKLEAFVREEVGFEDLNG
jgi:hypothetical protein